LKDIILENKSIIIKGARENNLKNISVTIPRNQITSIVGVSGSGKSSLAYNVLFSEGQRQFLESISTFAVRLLKKTQRPDVDEILNLSPTISIDQRKLRGSPRSTVGTATELYTYFRLLFSRFGSVNGLSAGHFSFNNPKGACKKCKGLGIEFTVAPEEIIDYSKSLCEGAVKYGTYKPGNRLYNIIKNSGRLDMSKKISEYDQDELYFLLYTPRVELSNKDQGFIQTFSHEGIITRLISRMGDLRGLSKSKEISDKPYVIERKCSECDGSRLNKMALSSLIKGKNIGYYSTLEINKLINEIDDIKINGADDLLSRIKNSLNYLDKVKLGYLSLNRGLDTLSGGEAQRLKLARELGNSPIEMVYIIDESTATLHSKDREYITDLIKAIKNQDNTVVLITHDKKLMEQADNIIEIGKGAGKLGGNVIFNGNYDGLLKCTDSITLEYIKRKSTIKTEFRKPKGSLKISNLSINNLKNVSVDIPIWILCSFTGVSGSGKSSLLIDGFARQYRDKVIVVDQSPTQGMARGNRVTYIGVFDKIRKMMAEENNVSLQLFSFNGKGACPECKGLGYRKIDMHFMGDVRVKCETCLGRRYKEDVLKYTISGKNMVDILNMTVGEVYNFFDDKAIKQQLNMLRAVGLSYIELGQSHDTFLRR